MILTIDQPEPITLDPERVLRAHRARTRQHLVALAHQTADLLEEIANLEAFAATQISAQQQPETQPQPTPPWGPEDPATPATN